MLKRLFFSEFWRLFRVFWTKRTNLSHANLENKTRRKYRECRVSHGQALSGIFSWSWFIAGYIIAEKIFGLNNSALLAQFLFVWLFG